MEIFKNNADKIIADKLSKKIAQKKCLCSNKWECDLNLQRASDFYSFSFNLYSQNPETDELFFLASYNLDASTRTGTYPLLKYPVCNQLTECFYYETCAPYPVCDICRWLEPQFEEFELNTFRVYCQGEYDVLTGSIEKYGVTHYASGPSWDGCSPYVFVPCSTLTEIHDNFEIISEDSFGYFNIVAIVPEQECGNGAQAFNCNFAPIGIQPYAEIKMYYKNLYEISGYFDLQNSHPMSNGAQLFDVIMGANKWEACGGSMPPP